MYQFNFKLTNTWGLKITAQGERAAFQLHLIFVPDFTVPTITMETVYCISIFFLSPGKIEVERKIKSFIKVKFNFFITTVQ